MAPGGETGQKRFGCGIVEFTVELVLPLGLLPLTQLIHQPGATARFHDLKPLLFDQGVALSLPQRKLAPLLDGEAAEGIEGHQVGGGDEPGFHQVALSGIALLVQALLVLIERLAPGEELTQAELFEIGLLFPQVEDTLEIEMESSHQQVLAKLRMLDTVSSGVA
ncbi:MAG: hypothetical protein NTY38_31345, partial [Acidobacteria bacterium]|nr:hypothetical protein [Acidobacteriota bacterium]